MSIYSFEKRPLAFQPKITFLHRIHVFNGNFLLLPALVRALPPVPLTLSISGFSCVTHHMSGKRSGGLPQFSKTNA